METRIIIFAFVAAVIMLGRKYLIEYINVNEKTGGNYSVKKIWNKVKFDIKYFMNGIKKKKKNDEK